MQSQWFVIHTLSGQEQKVKESIEKRIKAEEMGEYIKEVLVPMEKVVEVRNQKKTVSNRKLWPGYVFVDMVLLDENNRIIEKPWYFIKETQGVIGFVGGEPPVPTPTGRSRSHQGADFRLGRDEKPKVNFEVGETVKINNGPFLNFSGVIEEIEPDRGKLKVTVNIFGRNTPVELEYWQVEKGLKFYGKENYRTDQIADSGRAGESRPARWPGAGSARRQHHGLLQGIQCRDQRPGGHDDSRWSSPFIRTNRSRSSPSRRPRPVLLKKAAGIAAGSKTPNKEKVGKVTRKQVMDIVKMKAEGLECDQRRGGVPGHLRHRPQHGHRSRRITKPREST